MSSLIKMHSLILVCSSNEEISALSQSTGLVVSALSSLLVTTLALPVAGVPGAQLLHHPRYEEIKESLLVHSILFL